MASQPVVLGPGEKRTLDLLAYTQESGRFSVDLQLTTPDGRALGPAFELIVDSTAYGAITIAITLAALAVLGLAIVVRLGRRLRARRITGPTPAERGASDAVSGRQG
jgi:uridine phosphorylase